MGTQVAEKHQKQLKRIKKNIEQSYIYWKKNSDRYNFFRKFFLESSLTDADKTVLATLQKPQLEFNIGESYLSRLLGEFAKQMPSIEVSSADGYHTDPQLIQVVEDHFRACLTDANGDGFEYETYYESLSGGFSGMEVETDYENEYSLNQNIYFKKVYDPMMMGFDPLAVLPHKGDGRWFFKLYPKNKEEFEEEFPDININKISFTRNTQSGSHILGGFNWSYKNGKEDILLIGMYYEKKKKKVKLVRLADQRMMTEDDYKSFIDQWEKSGNIAQPPKVIESRTSTVNIICRYKLIENQILEYTETDFTELPGIFVDGHSVKIRDSEQGNVSQITRPYLYNALGIQKLKNLAGQSLANELENMVQHKFMAALEGIPPEYKDAYLDIQQASVLVYNAYKDNDPTIPLPPPNAVPRAPIPPEVTNSFKLSDEITQTILGSYDPGMVDNQRLAGVAIVESIASANSTAMPYVVSYIQALNQAAKIFVNLLPKYYVTPRSIPIIDREGKRSFVMINAEDGSGVQMNYPANALKVKVEAGVNFDVQKSRAIQQMTALAQAFPGFAAFINQEGLGIILDNLDIKGIELIKEKVQEFQEQMKQQQQQAAQAQQQQAQQPNPLIMLKQQELQQKAQQAQMQQQLDAERLTTERLKVLGDLQGDHIHNQVQLRKAQAEEFSHLADMAIKTEEFTHKKNMDKEDQLHRHTKEAIETHHKINSGNINEE